MGTLPRSPSYEEACRIADNWQIGEWQPTLDIICQRHQLEPVKIIQNFEGYNPVFELEMNKGKHLIIKILAPNWFGQFQSEQQSLALLNQHDLGITIPTLYGSGKVNNWHYLLMEKLEGILLSSVLSVLSQAEKLEIADSLGRFSARLHQIPIPPTSALLISWPEFIKAQTDNCYTKRECQGLPKALLSSLDEYLQQANFKLAIGTDKLIHTDLHPGNLMVKRLNNQYHLTGIIDLGDALACPDPLFEFTSPALLLALGDPEIFHAYLDGYGYTGSRGNGLQQHLMVLSLLRHTGDINNLLELVPNCRGVTNWQTLENYFFPL